MVVVKGGVLCLIGLMGQKLTFQRSASLAQNRYWTGSSGTPENQALRIHNESIYSAAIAKFLIGSEAHIQILESGNRRRFVHDIAVPTIVGVCVQVMGGVSGGGHHTAAEGHIMFIGNLCLLINTLASAVYYLGAKKLVQVSPL